MTFTIVFIVRSEFMKKSFYAEWILCAILLFAGIAVHCSGCGKTAEAGTFSESIPSNASFRDFTGSVFSELFDE